MKNKLLLIGWDGADWDIINPLLAQNKMPALKRVMQNGVYGNMSTLNPPYSPMLWSSVATGKTPDKHGVLGFIEISPDLNGVRQVTTNSRKSRAIWNILHNQGLKSNVVGWWPSTPAEPINGVIVSDTFQKVHPDPLKPSPLPEDAIHPYSERDNFVNLRMFPHEITKEHILPFIPQAAKIDQEENKLLQAFSKVTAHNVSLHNAATRLLRTSDWDFMAVYHDYIDHFCHSFMKFHPPRLKMIPEDTYEIFKDTVDGAYMFQDMMLERTLSLIDDDTTVIIMSDHGYESGNKRILKMPKVQAAPALEHRQFGIFIAMGPNIKKNEKVFGLNLLDVAPTILHHYNLPVGEDMDGRVMADIFKNFKKPSFIKSWEEVEGDFADIKDKNKVADFSDQDAIEQLIELGYIERPDENKETAIHKTKCDLKHNLARVYLGKKDYEGAENLLMELVLEEDPIDTAPYYIDLIKIRLKQKKFAEAEEYLQIVKDSNTEVQYNLFFMESDILINKGKLGEALALAEQVTLGRNNSEMLFKKGEIQFLLMDFKGAVVSFEKAIEIEPGRAKYHRAIAEAYLELEEYEEAVEYALISLELVRYFPSAHYTLGRALEKLGDLENAKIAFETAERLQPRDPAKARIAKENILEAIKVPKDSKDKKKYEYRQDQIVVVSGLPRSGTSLMMQMLEAGGLHILTDNKRKPDNSNPKGYYEYDPVMALNNDNSWLHKAQNKAVKIVAPLLRHLDSKHRYKIIFMTRDLKEVVKSQQVMRKKDTQTIPFGLFESFDKLFKSINIWDNREPGVEILYMDYKDVRENPEENARKIQDFLGQELKSSAMANCVDKTLYRNKV